MRNERRFPFNLFAVSRFALIAAVIGASFVVVGCGSKQDKAAVAPPASANAAPDQPVHTPAQQDAIIKEAADGKNN